MAHAPGRQPAAEHLLVERQLRRAGLERGRLPSDDEAWRAFLDSVSKTYAQADQDRSLIERSLRISSDEMRMLHERLEARNAQLEAARAAAEAASASKSRFLANMSHEIRTPMTAILGFADLLLEGSCHPNQKAEYGQTIRRNARHLLTVIDDILDFSKIEAGHMSLERTPVRLDRIIEELRSLMAVSAASKGVELRVDTSALADIVVATDPVRVRQVVLNLLSNAVKFTSRGSVTLTATRAAEEGTVQRITIEIADTGIGMTDQEVAALFQPFTQADASTTRRFGGTGLGLAISRRLASLLDGELDVSSRAGEGSTFRFRFRAPLETVAAAERSDRAGLTDAGHDTLRGVSILLVEDGPDNQRLISHFLKHAGADVAVAENGRVAVDMLVSSDAASFDLILMDMQMPVMDGYSATSTLRTSGITTPIVALTAHAMASDRDACFAAGCDDYCTKPIARSSLLSLCATWVARSRAA